MNIAQAKEEIKNTVRVYTRKNEDGSYNFKYDKYEIA